MRLFKILFVICYLLFVICLLPASARAQIPPDYTPCNETGDPEFHSLRPYQASPCGSKLVPFASFCGNDLTLKDTVTAQYPDGGGVCRQKEGEEKIICKFSVSVSKDITIDLSGAELPIMGNTEDAINSQNPTDTLDDAQRTNDYVSWYLNGTIGRAEYPFINPKDAADASKLVNFSGPINRLLPQETQQRYRAQTVKDAIASLGGAGIRHDQIVGCTYGINIFGHEIGGIPGPCYEAGLKSLLPHQGHRLSEWGNNLPPARSDFDNYTDYYKKYQAWRGKVCFEIEIPAFIPIIGGKSLLLCGENPLSPNYYSNLYSYIPLSSTEDTKGKISIDNASSAAQPDGATVTGVSFSNQTPADLFFSHTEEADELGKILQNTYAQKGADLTGAPTGVDPAECKTVDVRSNPGDDLFAGGISGTLNYKASFSCEFDPRPPSRIPGPPQTCSKDIYISLSTKTAVPGMENVWSRLVAGPASVFKRIFPKLGKGSGIGSIKDIPGSTAINYSGGGVSESTDLKLPHLGGISEYFLKGIQTILRPKGYGETISFGETSPIGSISSTGSIDICSDLTNCNQNPDQVDLTGVKEKFIDLANRWLGVGRPRIDMYETVVNSAQTAGVDPIFTLAIWLNESGASNYDGACQVLGHGDPSSINCQRAQDFGINSPSKETQHKPNGNIIVDHFMDQLKIFIGLPNYYYSSCKSSSSAKCPMEIFGEMFKWGECNPTSNSNAYIAGILGIYDWLKPSQTKPCYPIALP